MRTPQVWGKTALTFDPARHLDTQGGFVRPDPPHFHAFGTGPRLWYIRPLHPYGAR